MQARVGHLERAADGEAAGALVFFHGFYGIPDDFVPFMDKLDPGRRLHAFLPKAPFEIAEGWASWFDPATEWRRLSDLDAVAAWVDALPFLIGHGRADESVPVAEARAACERLRAVGSEPLYLETGVDHRIDQAIVPALRDFVSALP